MKINSCKHVPITMHEKERVGSLIKKLKEEIALQKISALQDFWKEVDRQGTPLLDPIEESTSEMLVTFVWRATAAHQNVVVASYGIASFDPLKNKMSHVPNTDVWYKGWILPKNARTVYCFSIDDPLIAISDYRLDQFALPSFSYSWTEDPLNAKKYLIPASLRSAGKDLVMSLLEMAETAEFPWLREEISPKGIISTVQIPSETFEAGREAYVYLPADYDSDRSTLYPLVVAFDGYAFKDFVNGPAIFDYLIAHKKIPPTVVVMILNPDPNAITRVRDLACYEPFFNYIAHELMPWVRKNYHVTSDPHQTVITGASLGAQAAVYMGLIHSELFGNVLAQSGAYWWQINGEQDWLIHRYVESPTLDLKFFLNVGSLETVSTFANGLSILNANRYLRDVLKAKGYPVNYVEFAGGHDYICFQETFAEGMQYLLNPVGTRAKVAVRVNRF